MVFPLLPHARTLFPCTAIWCHRRRRATDAGLPQIHLQNYIIGHLGEGNTDSWTFPLGADTEYIITSACDSDCSGFDLMVNDGSGRIIERLPTTDDVPVIQLEVGSNAR